MEYGSVFGHGAYLGPDYTADYLRRSSDLVRRCSAAPTPTGRCGRRSRTCARTATTRARSTLHLQRGRRRRRSAGWCRTTAAFFSDPTTEHGLRQDAITDPTQLRQLTAFFAWTAWAAAANRPGHNYSYTNNWPSEPRVDNKPTANVIVWSVLSLIALLGGIGLLFGAFGRWGRSLGWHGREQATLSFRAPGDVALTPAQRATAWFFFVMAALFLLQTLVGAAAQHYRADIDELLRHRPGARLPVQPDAHLARAAGDLLGRDLVRRRRDLPGADDRRGASRRTRASSPSRCSGRSRSSSSAR